VSYEFYGVSISYRQREKRMGKRKEKGRDGDVVKN
jgi:hypothetical protein